LTLLRIDGNRFGESEGKQALGRHYRRPAGSKKDTGDSRHSTRRSTDSSAHASVNCATNRRSQAGGSGNGCGVTSFGGTSGGLDQLRLNGQLVSVDHWNIAQGYSQRRHSLYAPGFLHGYHMANRNLPAACNDPAINYDRLFQRSAEPVTLHVGIAREAAHQAHCDERPGRNG
jgi:hypothetical protein